MSKALKNVFILLFLAFSASSVSAEANKNTANTDVEPDTELEGMSVMGSNEQPQVLYIVPWQPPSYQKRTQHPPSAVLSGILEPLEPSFHKEDFHFRKKLEVKVQRLNSN